MKLFDRVDIAPDMEQIFRPLDESVAKATKLHRDAAHSLRKLKTAVDVGSCTSIGKTLTELRFCLSQLVGLIAEIDTSRLEILTRQALSTTQYLDELRAAAEKLALIDVVPKVDGIAATPLRIAVGEGVVRISGKITDVIRPSALVARLRAMREEFSKRSVDIAAAAEQAYVLHLSKTKKVYGDAVPLQEIHSILTLLPGVSKSYSVQNLVYDIRLWLDTGNQRVTNAVMPRLVKSRDGKGVYFVSKSGEETFYNSLAFDRIT